MFSSAMSASPKDLLLRSSCPQPDQCTHQGLASDKGDGSEGTAVELSVASNVDPTVLLACSPQPSTSSGGRAEPESRSAPVMHANAPTVGYARIAESNGCAAAPFFCYGFRSSNNSPESMPETTEDALQATMALRSLRADVDDHATRPGKRRKCDDGTGVAQLSCIAALQREIARCVDEFIGRPTQITMQSVQDDTHLTLHFIC